MSSIHGHELMRWLGANGPMPREQLLAQAATHFGPEARFHTCSAQDLTLEGLLDFLSGKGKIAPEGEHLALAMPPCDHEH